NSDLFEKRKKKHELEDVNDLDLQVKLDAPFGTVFLDEFGELHPSVQALLLRFLENGEIQPLGYEGTISLRDEHENVHIRFIAATNREEFRELLANNTSGEVKEPGDEAADHDAPTMVLGRVGYSSDGSTVRADLIYRLAQWIVELPDLQPGEVDYLINIEKNSRPSL